MKNFDVITDTEQNNLKLVLKSLLVGIITSFIVIIYRFALSYAEDFAFFIYNYIKRNIYLIPIWFIILIIFAFIIGKLIDKEPYTAKKAAKAEKAPAKPKKAARTKA